MAAGEQVSNMFDTILVLDFGSQYSHLITRRLREFNIYAEMLPCTQKISELGWTPKGVILSGGPYSVYAEDAPHVDHAIFDLNVPILGICYGMQELAWINGKQVGRGDKREYGPATLKVIDDSNSLFKGMNDSTVWMFTVINCTACQLVTRPLPPPITPHTVVLSTKLSQSMVFNSTQKLHILPKVRLF